MARQYSMPASFPPVKLLAAAADSAGRTSANYASLINCDGKAWLVCEVNQGAANTVTFTPLQATSDTGIGSKGLTNNVPIWLVENAGSADALVAQAAGTSFTTDAAEHDKLVIFEITPEVALDMVNGFNHIGVSTGASSASNITSAAIYVFGSYQGAAPPTTIQ